ncbi:RNA polymerase sigma24 factor [Micromonospora humidisoli]|uniref:RNA polymerase sigma-70 factor n=1 Tax=Micromonospora humidisoli TaxID=2807622 RepID=A0ABS2JK69_9ACTN|nr:MULTISPECIES: RNA polymerase sigma-70 factor [Micromonospora]MBM7085859.1 RNA polymerase sigma-70 factor [Micromonospora humidisoli]GHJ08458.1 RNA polymerase sigma24 factor [Micromonospora sp. AKA109]
MTTGSGAAADAPAAVAPADLTAFLDVRPRLFGLAYRMLGSVVEAEDVVQEAWLRWQRADRSRVRNPAAFLTTTTTRLAVNAATSARATRETYVGPWLPEPVATDADPTLGAERAAALDVAVLLLLERLTPAERAAYVLREAFDYPYREIAEVLGTSEPNARQLATRARRHLAVEGPAPAAPQHRRRLAQALLGAARDGDLATLERLLTADVVARSDGGGRVHAARRDVCGPARVTNFLDNVRRKYWRGTTVGLVEVNGGPGVLVAADRPVTLITLDTSVRGIERLLLVVNPDKLARLPTRR